MTKTDRKTADRLKSALDNIGATVRRTQVYDLIAAARGLRNRELLKQPYAISDQADDNLLRAVAERIDAGLADEIATCAAAVALPTPLTCEIRHDWQGASFDITFDELSDPAAFLGGPRGAKGVEVIARNIYHSAYYLDRSDSGLDLRQGNDLAGKILETTEHCERYGILEEFYGEPKQSHDSLHEQSEEVDDALRALGELAQNVGVDFDEYEWREPLEAAIIEHLEEDDDSSVEDMIQSGDRAELLFLFAMKGGHVNDMMVTSEYRSSHPKDVNLDRNFQFALSRLGYTIGEFRRFSGSEREASDDLDHELVPLPRALVTPGQLMELLDNAGDSYFHIGLYLQVPVSEVLKLDATKPIVLKNVHLCAYGPINGTHHDGPVIEEITVLPEDGVLIAASSSPSDLCGYVNSYYHGTATNVAEEPGTEKGEVVAFHGDMDVQLRLSFAA